MLNPVRSLPVLLVAASLVGGCSGGDACDAPGAACVFVGDPGVAQFQSDELPRLETRLYLPQDIEFQPGTNHGYYLDFNNHRIRMVDSEGIVRNVGGTGMLGDGPDQIDARFAAFNHPTNLAFHPDDPEELHIAAWHNSRLEMIDLRTNELRFTCGTGGRAFGGDGGPAIDAILDLPSGIAFHPDGRLFISDQANQIIREVDQDFIIRTIAGTQRVTGYEGDGGPALEATFHAQVGQAADPSSRLALLGERLFIADTSNHAVRVIDLDTMIVDTYVGTGAPGTKDGDRGQAQLNNPRDLAFSADGTLYIADTDNHCVRAVAPGGEVRTVVGTCGESGMIDGPTTADAVLLNKPYGVAIDQDGALYVSDTYNHVILRVIPEE